MIQDVSDTAFMIAAYRAIETERPDARFHDPLAERLAGEHGRRIVAGFQRASQFIGWSVVVRTCLIDDFIHRAIDEGVDTVLNLGAGLDTRPYRLSLPKSLRWIEIDYPHMIEFKESQLSGEVPTCQLERIELDLADRPARRAVLSEINAGAKKVLVLTEGVVLYLPVEEVASLADDLQSQSTFCAWIVDYFSPAAHKFRDRNSQKNMQNAPFLFRPDDYYGFFKEHGWIVRETRYLADEGDRLGRPLPMPLFLKWLVRVTRVFAPREKRDAFRRFSAYVLFEPARVSRSWS